MVCSPTTSNFIALCRLCTRFPTRRFVYGKLPWFNLRMDSPNDIHVLTRAVTKGPRLGISASYYIYSVRAWPQASCSFMYTSCTNFLTDLLLACENIHFSTLFASRDVLSWTSQPGRVRRNRCFCRLIYNLYPATWDLIWSTATSFCLSVSRQGNLVFCR